MTRVVLAGGGTAGHVNPLLAVADELQRSHGLSARDISVIGTSEGLESRLVPEAGLVLHTLARLPFPRKLNLQAVAFAPRFILATVQALRMITRHRADVVAGFGGYASAPVYVAAWLSRTPLVIHEANAVPGFANLLGATLTRQVLTAFPTPRLRGAQVIGMPMKRSITHPASRPSLAQARTHFGLKPRIKTLLVTGGSQGAKRINDTLASLSEVVTGAGWQVLHIVGGTRDIPSDMPLGYVGMKYCDRMDLALASATAVISRAGAATVSEIQVLHIPAVFVPYPVGNGEQEKNARDSIECGAAILVRDADFTREKVIATLLPILQNEGVLERMSRAAAGLGKSDAAEHMAAAMMKMTQKESR